ncbi:MAG: carboxypeptidase regulatory-like domain-containing protein [Pirellulales bacterium]|nr:carboxypeptidase regulatory-like domain-containing protein [Pirellulales bacterium]
MGLPPMCPRTLAPVVVALSMLLGCGGKSTAPTTYSITGIVTADGRPVAGALVQYHPVNADYTPLAADARAVGGQATTGDDGSYTVEATFDMGKTDVRGLPAGAYAVTVVKMDAGSGPASLDSPPKNVLDPRYAMVDTTPVKVTIEPEGRHDFDIPL